MEFRRVKAGVRGPFLVVAPLTTLGHWRREIETWTDMNVICFMGGKDDRQLIVDHELWYREPGANGRLGRKTRTPKFHVMLTSFEILRDCASVFTQFAWDITIVDEAHRLKALQSATRCALRSHVSAVGISIPINVPRLRNTACCVLHCAVLAPRNQRQTLAITWSLPCLCAGRASGT
jgi:SNF2 family DNA or RNA helicase